MAVAEVWSHWGQDKEGVCRVLGELCSTVFQWSTKDVAETLKNTDGVAEEFLMWFFACAEEKERNMKHDQNGINAPEYKPYKIRANQYGILFVKPYFSLRISGSQGDFEILFPPYEEQALRSLVNVPVA